MKNLKHLFNPKPRQWGLRGDPVLWSIIEKRLSDDKIPDTIEDLVSLLENAFRLETSHNLASIDTIHDEKFASEGMSSGSISGDFWRDVAFPLILQRYSELKGAEHHS